ncbi:MAG: DUF433 domain-containing protein [Verrucomicrobia bacterium]|jgi:uncharacterized protein (DUF433 family)|nr:DUF433 domain-containing protein [Verrucomicrobiota bacterium]
MNLIESKPDVMMGKPVIVGTRLTVEGILERLAAGETIDAVIAEHPRLTREAVLAAIEFAARALRADVVYPVPGHAA